MIKDEFEREIKKGDFIETSKKTVYEIVSVSGDLAVKDSEGRIMDIKHLNNFMAFWRR